MSEPKTAEEAFLEVILEDMPPPASVTTEDRPRYAYGGGLHGRVFNLASSIPDGYSSYSTKATDALKKDEQVVSLQPYRGPVHGRLDRQAVELRRRLSNPKAVMLVMRGKTYSAESVWGVLWLYLKTRFFKRWTKKNYPSLATS